MQQALKTLLFVVLAAFPFLAQAEVWCNQPTTTPTYREYYCSGSGQALCEKRGKGNFVPHSSWPDYGHCSLDGYFTISILVAVPNCPEGQSRNPETAICEYPTTCPEGKHLVNSLCVPDNCPDYQAWNPEQNKCVPTLPPPLGGSPYDGVKFFKTGPLNPDGTAPPLPPGAHYGNCGGYQCYFTENDFVPPDQGGGCWEYESDPGYSYCAYKPYYDAVCLNPYPDGTCAGGTDRPATFSPKPYVPPTDQSAPPSFDSPPIHDPQSQTPPPPPVQTCPTGYTYNSATGLCITGQSPGDPTRPDGPSAPPNPGQASCPVGYTLQLDGTCRSTNSPAYCPAGYTLVNGQCQSSGTYNPTNGTPNSGQYGATCGGPGQSPCSVVIADPGNNDAINNAVPSEASQSNLSNSVDALRDALFSWGENDPSADSQSTYSSLFDGWFDVIPSGGCSPMTATILGHTLTINHCQHAPLIADILGYALWLYFAASTFLMLTGGKPQ